MYHGRSDQDLTRYLMKLLNALQRLQAETGHHAHDADQQFHPLARAQLTAVSVHLQQAHEAVDRATAYGVACKLVRGDHLGEAGASPCDAEHLYEALVWLPEEGYDELACPPHASAAVRAIPGATSGRTRTPATGTTPRQEAHL
ncbi:hypothetical protein [Nonomuraea aurantiaca]|uniref:hypothetical protein n=1 Tax=Nonomuraea aurantiaca TaxID=2878562 RepID=UPI001CD96E12|nr:hypothetical protein [Nonomuraea aurantiaca]MCA2230141.1 hypothetical protein [Nonomuraea aurantiaca]